MNPYQLVRSYLTQTQLEKESVLKQKFGQDLAQHVSSIAVIDPVKTTQRHFRRSRKIKSNNENLYSFYMNLIELEKAVRTHRDLNGTNGIDWLQTKKPALLTFIDTYKEDDTHTRIPNITNLFSVLREKIISITNKVPDRNENKQLRTLILNIMRGIYKKLISRWLPPPRSDAATQVQSVEYAQNYPPMGQGFKKKEKKRTKKARKAKKAKKETPKK
jgi:hypothetical protein